MPGRALALSRRRRIEFPIETTPDGHPFSFTREPGGRRPPIHDRNIDPGRIVSNRTPRFNGGRKNESTVLSPANLFAMAGNLRVDSDRWKKILFARRT
jgi:hypothetical protein